MKQYLKERRHAVHNKWVLWLNSMEEIEKSDDPESAYVCCKNRVDKLYLRIPANFYSTSA